MMDFILILNDMIETICPAQPVTLVTGIWDTDSSTIQKLLDTVDLKTARTSLIIFGKKEILDSIESLSNYDPCSVRLYTDYDEPSEIDEFKSWLTQYKRYQQLSKDPFKESKRTIRDYLLGNIRSWLLRDVSTRNPFKSRYFFWIDHQQLSNFKLNGFTHWPSFEQLEHWYSLKYVTQFSEQEEELINSRQLILFFAETTPNHKYFKSERRTSDGPIPAQFINPSFFGGPSQSIQSFHYYFVLLHNYFMRNDHFIGDTQDIFNSLAVARRRRTLIVQSDETVNGENQPVLMEKILV